MQGLIKKLRKMFKAFFNPKKHMKYIYYYFSMLFSVKKKQVLIESFHGQNISDSGLVLAKEIIKHYPNEYKIYFASEKPDEQQKFIDAIGLDVELIDVASFKYTKILATSKYIMTNVSLPIYFMKRKEQVYLQTWHGTPLKTLGKKMRMGIDSMYLAQHGFLQADYLSQPNDFTRDIIMQNYNLERVYTGKVVMAGYPRNQIFMDEQAGKELKKKLGYEGYTTYAYMPTWRGTSVRDVKKLEYAAESIEILNQLDEHMSDDTILFVNFHPILRGCVSLGEYKHIKPFPSDIDNYEFLNSVDALITDYSSVFFDYSLTKKPIILFMYDYDEYLRDRGLQLDIRTLPFRKLYSVEEMAKCLETGECLNDSYVDTDYYKEFFKYDSPDIAHKLLELVLKGNEGDLEIVDYSFNKDKPVNLYMPEKVTGRAEFNTLSALAGGEDDVVILQRKWFKKELNPILHDEYNDKFNYVITTRAFPKSYFEIIGAKLSGRIRNKVLRRELEYTLPGIKLKGQPKKDLSVFKKDHSVCLEKLKKMPLGDYKVTSDGIEIKPSLKGNYKPVRIALVSSKEQVISVRDVTAEELKSGVFTYELKNSVNDFSFYRNQSAVPIILCKEEGKGKLVAFAFESTNGRSFFEPFTLDCALPVDYFRIDLKTLMESISEVVKETLTQYDLTPVDTTVDLLPHIDTKTGFFSLYLCNEEKMGTKLYAPAKFTSLKTRGNRCSFNISMNGFSGGKLEGVVLKSRSKIDAIEIPMTAKIKQSGDKAKAKVRFEFTEDMPISDVYWDVMLEVNYYGKRILVNAASKSHLMSLKLHLGNYECAIGESDIIFPYLAKNGKFSFCFRNKCEYDNMTTRFKEMTAFCIYELLRPYLKSKKYWVIYGKFCKSAQDNSFYFFRHCMENLPKSERKHIFYIIDKSSPDYENVKKYGRNVVKFMSVRHMLYCLSMSICISEDSKMHLYYWRSKPSIINRRIRRKKELFLQHGVTALKKVHTVFGKKSANPMTYFVTTSKLEQDIIVNNFDYNINNVPITGFCRWDALVDKSDKDDRFILLMPTWRSWLEDVSNEVFLSSDYYNNYSALLTDSRLDEILTRNNTRLVFCLHPKFAEYIDNFKDKSSKRVSFVSMGEIPVNELIMKCSMLITDYSSVCWDTLYLNKPVLYYQFDFDMYDIAHGSYINMKTDLPGERSTDLDKLIEDIDKCASGDFKLTEQALEKLENYFSFHDNNNCQRVYEYLKLMGH